MLSKKNYGSYGSQESFTTSQNQTTKNQTSYSQGYNQGGFSTYQSNTSNFIPPSESNTSSSKISNLFRKKNDYENIDNLSNRMGSLNKNYYDKAKKHRDETGYVWKAIQDMISYLMSFVGDGNKSNGSIDSGYEQAELYLDPEKKKLFDKFKSFAIVKYNSDSQNHEALLMKFWKLCMNDVELESRVSSQWKGLGFQGKDPQTDFRSAGIYSLMNLIYFAETYPKKFKKMLERTQKEKNGYPFAIAGVNVTMLLLETLGVHKGNNFSNIQARKSFVDLLFDSKLPFRTVEDDMDVNQQNLTKKSQKEAVLLSFDDNGENFLDFNNLKENNEKMTKEASKKKRLYKKFNVTFDEIFVTTFILLDSNWWETSAHYFQFPDILKKTRKEVEALLEDKFTDLEDIRRHNKRVTSSKKRHRKQ